MTAASLTEAQPRRDEPLIHSASRTLLVVDDDEEIRTLAAELLVKAGFNAMTAYDGPSMFLILNAQPIDLVVLDLNLPGEDGLSLCRIARASRNIPIIMLTARGEAIDRVIGLEVGADDYITKPFEPREFVARVRSVLRRAYAPLAPQEPPPPKRATFRGWIFDFENRRLADPRGRIVMLSGNEFSLLKFLVEHANEVLTREQLLTLTSNPAMIDSAAQRVADLQISRLRNKLGDKTSQLIMSVRGQGYVLATAVTFE